MGDSKRRRLKQQEGKVAVADVEVLTKRETIRKEDVDRWPRPLVLERVRVTPGEKGWTVENLSKRGAEGIRYSVAHYSDGGWACNCPYFMNTRRICKHIKAVESAIKEEPELARGGDFLKTPEYQPFAPTLIPNFKIGGVSARQWPPKGMEMLFLKDRDQVTVVCDLEREENQFGVPVVEEGQERKVSLKITYVGPETKGQRVRIGYIPNNYLRNNPNLLDPKKSHKVALSVARITTPQGKRIIVTGNIIS